MAHQRALERDRADPLAARLDQVLRPILHLHGRRRVDRHDVAGLEPAVVGEAIAGVGAVVVARWRSTVRAPRARPSSVPSQGTRPSSLRARISTNGDGPPLLRAVAELDRRRSRRPSTAGSARPCRAAPSRSCPTRGRSCRPWRFSNASISACGTAEPPTIHRADRREVERAGVGVQDLQHAHPDRRHAAGHRDALASEADRRGSRDRDAARAAPAWRPPSRAENGMPQALA